MADRHDELHAPERAHGSLDRALGLPELPSDEPDPGSRVPAIWVCVIREDEEYVPQVSRQVERVDVVAELVAQGLVPFPGSRGSSSWIAIRRWPVEIASLSKAAAARSVAV